MYYLLCPDHEHLTFSPVTIIKSIITFCPIYRRTSPGYTPLKNAINFLFIESIDSN